MKCENTFFSSSQTETDQLSPSHIVLAKITCYFRALEHILKKIYPPLNTDSSYVMLT